MSINYCTIGTGRIDGFCGTQRAKVLARLIHEAGHDPIIVVPPTPVTPPRAVGGSASIGVPGFSFTPGVSAPHPQRPRQSPYQQPDIDQNLLPREQPVVTVSAEIMGTRGSESIEATSRLDFVIVTDLEINAEPAITVNISEMEI